MKIYKAHIAYNIITVIFGIIIIYQYHLANASTLQIQSAKFENENISKQYYATLDRLKSADNRIAVLTNSIPQIAPEADRPYENVLEAWIAKVRRLSDYLRSHPEKAIPQMELLTPEEWLDATKNHDFSNEADFRRALGELRGMARQKIASNIGEAWQKAISQNNGEPPANISMMKEFLSTEVHFNVLDQLLYNKSGVVPGIRAPQGRGRFFLVDKPIDIWDSTLFYATDGSWGVRSAAASGEQVVIDAIQSYKMVNGYSPSSYMEIMGLSGISELDQPTAVEIFNALNKTVDVGK